MSRAATLSELAVALSADSSGFALLNEKLPQFDSSARVATTQFVESSGLHYAGVTQYNASATLTTADVGKVIVVGSGGGVFTLPSTAGLPVGSSISFVVQGGTATIEPVAGQTIANSSQTGLTSLTLTGADYCTLTCFVPGAAWVVSSGTPLFTTRVGVFGATLALPSGYQKHPSGFIIQWGNAESTGTEANITFPLAFSTAAVAFSAFVSATEPVTIYTPGGGINRIGATVFWDNGAPSFIWMAMGY